MPDEPHGEAAPNGETPPPSHPPGYSAERAKFPNLKQTSGHHGKPTRTVYEIATAMRKCNGDRKEAAKFLDLQYDTLCDRINNDEKLKQLFGQKIKEMPAPPTIADVADRSAGDLPLPSELPEAEKDSVAANLKLVSLVSPEDADRLIKGLREFDFSEKSLEKIRALGSLATDTGRFIAVSLEKTHQAYVVQILGLIELGGNLRKRLVIEPGQEGYVADEETRVSLHKNYAEVVRESGRGVERMMQMAEVIARMLESASAKTTHAKTKRGWKKVTALEAHHNGQEARS